MVFPELVVPWGSSFHTTVRAGEGCLVLNEHSRHVSLLAAETLCVVRQQIKKCENEFLNDLKKHPEPLKMRGIPRCHGK